jgi:hypothetical protein
MPPAHSSISILFRGLKVRLIMFQCNSDQEEVFGEAEAVRKTTDDGRQTSPHS